MVSTKYLEDPEINSEIYFGKEWRNTLLFIRPQLSGDLIEDRDLLLRAQRLLVCEEMEKDLAKEKVPQLRDLKEREGEGLKKRLQEVYGHWMKPIGTREETSFRPIECQLEASDILEKVRQAFGGEATELAVQEAVEEHKERGIRFEDLQIMFLKQLGRPIVLDMDLLRERVRRLCERGEIVLERAKRIYSKDNLPLDIPGDMVLYHKDYAPSVTEEQKIRISTEIVSSQEATSIQDGGITVVKPPPPVIEELRTIAIESSEHRTPFNLQTELEGRLLGDDLIKSLTITFTGSGVQESGRLEEFASGCGDAHVEMDLAITVRFRQATDKGTVLKILDKLPLPKEGSLQARLEVEREQGQAARKGFDQYVDQYVKQSKGKA